MELTNFKEAKRCLLHLLVRTWVLLVIGGMFFFHIPAMAQSVKTITGTVVDNTGLPLPGANVTLKKSTNAQGVPVGTATEVDGTFKLQVPADEDSFIVSFIGFKTQEITIGERTVFNIKLELDAQELDDVIVNGMFTRKANSYTGAVTSIKGEDLKMVGNSNLIASLKNLDPSFMIIENLAAGSNPNALPEIQLRGQTGLPDIGNEYQSNPNLPLFILDGFETTLTRIMDMDMNLVESINILKDATAKAIYGSKAANGVVVIETRRPEKGRMKITYNGSLQIEAPDSTSYSLTNAREKLEAELRARLYTSESAKEQITLTQAYNNLLREVEAGVNTDWLAQPIRTGVGQKHSLYLEGGDDYMLYGIDLMYNRVTGVLKGSDRSTISGGITLSYRLKNFLFRNKLSIDDNVANDSPYGSFSEFARLNPYNKIYDENGQFVPYYTYGGEPEGNPIYNGMINTLYQTKYNYISNNFYAEWNVLQNLRLTGRFGFSKKTQNSDDFKPSGHTDFYNYASSEMYRKGSYTAGNRKENSLDGDIGVGWSKEIEKHVIFLNAQGTISQIKYDYWTAQAEGFPNNKMDHISFAVQYLKDAKPIGSEGISRNLGLIGSMNYSYDNRYLFDANYRLSGSSEFDANNRWGSFWSVGAGWNLHYEEFLKDVEWMDRLKLRASFGYTGSQGFSPYQAIATFKYYMDTNYNGYIGSYLVALGNPDLRWQKRADTNIGIDIDLFHNRLNARFDYYIANTDGFLINVTTPPSMGFYSYVDN
ncbi:MAG: SusC/RagA family TonB-linked outer membrane protein [Odoribacter sp.]|nr:SusC/RagA family TonB-linked outer membrane protein [Odoribacter sp.]